MDIPEKIQKLKQDHKAVILAHNYQPPEIQDLADFTGDSLDLSIRAAKLDASVIVFCGVRFMAETAAILSLGKTVVLPDKLADCPLADMITVDQLRQLKYAHAGALVVCYVNSSAEIKAQSDYCCTSANATEVVSLLPADKEVIFIPDQHLGQFVAGRTGRSLVLWPGYCPTHVLITAEDIEQKRAQYRGAVVMVHPECSEAVKEIADQVLSTGQMLRFAAASGANRFVIATEVGIIHALKKHNPNKVFVAASDRAVCPNMKRITLEKIVWALEDISYCGGAKSPYIVSVPEDIRVKAKKALDRMVEILPKK